MPHMIDPLCTHCPSKGKKLGNFHRGYGNFPRDDYVKLDIYKSMSDRKSPELVTLRQVFPPT